MMPFLAGVLFLCASAAGWVLIALVAVDAVRYRRAGPEWTAVTTHDGDRP